MDSQARVVVPKSPMDRVAPERRELMSRAGLSESADQAAEHLPVGVAESGVIGEKYNIDERPPGGGVAPLPGVASRSRLDTLDRQEQVQQLKSDKNLHDEDSKERDDSPAMSATSAGSLNRRMRNATRQNTKSIISPSPAAKDTLADPGTRLPTGSPVSERSKDQGTVAGAQTTRTVDKDATTRTGRSAVTKITEGGASMGAFGVGKSEASGKKFDANDGPTKDISASKVPSRAGSFQPTNRTGREGGARSEAQHDLTKKTDVAPRRQGSLPPTKRQGSLPPTKRDTMDPGLSLADIAQPGALKGADNDGAGAAMIGLTPPALEPQAKEDDADFLQDLVPGLDKLATGMPGASLRADSPASRADTALHSLADVQTAPHGLGAPPPLPPLQHVDGGRIAEGVIPPHPGIPAHTAMARAPRTASTTGNFDDTVNRDGLSAMASVSQRRSIQTSGSFPAAAPHSPVQVMRDHGFQPGRGSLLGSESGTITPQAPTPMRSDSPIVPPLAGAAATEPSIPLESGGSPKSDQMPVLPPQNEYAFSPTMRDKAAESVAQQESHGGATPQSLVSDRDIGAGAATAAAAAAAAPFASLAADLTTGVDPQQVSATPLSKQGSGTIPAPTRTGSDLITKRTSFDTAKAQSMEFADKGASSTPPVRRGSAAVPFASAAAAVAPAAVAISRRKSDEPLSQPPSVPARSTQSVERTTSNTASSHGFGSREFSSFGQQQTMTSMESQSFKRTTTMASASSAADRRLHGSAGSVHDLTLGQQISRTVSNLDDPTAVAGQQSMATSATPASEQFGTASVGTKTPPELASPPDTGTPRAKDVAQDVTSSMTITPTTVAGDATTQPADGSFGAASLGAVLATPPNLEAHQKILQHAHDAYGNKSEVDPTIEHASKFLHRQISPEAGSGDPGYETTEIEMKAEIERQLQHVNDLQKVADSKMAATLLDIKDPTSDQLNQQAELVQMSGALEKQLKNLQDQQKAMQEGRVPALDPSKPAADQLLQAATKRQEAVPIDPQQVTQQMPTAGAASIAQSSSVPPASSVVDGGRLKSILKQNIVQPTPTRFTDVALDEALAFCEAGDTVYKHFARVKRCIPRRGAKRVFWLNIEKGVLLWDKPRKVPKPVKQEKKEEINEERKGSKASIVPKLPTVAEGEENEKTTERQGRSSRGSQGALEQVARRRSNSAKRGSGAGSSSLVVRDPEKSQRRARFDLGDDHVDEEEDGPLLDGQEGEEGENLSPEGKEKDQLYATKVWEKVKTYGGQSVSAMANMSLTDQSRRHAQPDAPRRPPLEFSADARRIALGSIRSVTAVADPSQDSPSSGGGRKGALGKRDRDSELSRMILVNTQDRTLHLVASSRRAARLWITALEFAGERAQARLRVHGGGARKGDAYIREMFQCADTRGKGSLDRRQVNALLNKLNIRITGEIVKITLRDFDPDHRGLTEDEFVGLFFKLASTRAVSRVFRENAMTFPNGEFGHPSDDEKRGDPVWTRRDYIRWAKIFQDIEFSEVDVQKQWRRLEPPMITESGLLQEVGFFVLLANYENLIVPPPVQGKTDHDMTRPLTDYWVASSHNTYLERDQLVGRSSVEQYARVLSRGCRCIEIDIWDGDDGEPVVTHGWTLTSSVLLEDVLAGLNSFTFLKNDWPLVISIEQHCKSRGKMRCAALFEHYLGDRILRLSDTQEIPSPEDCLGRIVIKAKLALPKGQQGNTGHHGSLHGGVTGSDWDADSQQESDFGDSRFSESDFTDRDESQTPRSRGAAGRRRSTSRNARPRSSSREVGGLFRKGSAPKIGRMELNVRKMSIGQKSIDETQIPGTPGTPRSVASSRAMSSKSISFPHKPSSETNKDEEDFEEELDETGGDGDQESQHDSQISREQSGGGGKKLSRAYSDSAALSSSQYGGREDASFYGGAQQHHLANNGHLAPYNDIVFLVGTKFKRFSDRRAPTAICSFSEKRMWEILKKYPEDLFKFHDEELSRVYPRGTRFQSGNYNPIPFWAIGSQFQALNYQYLDAGVLVNDGLFRWENGGSGYVLKPERVRNHLIDPQLIRGSRDVPTWPSQREVHRTYIITIHSGHNLPKPAHDAKRGVIDPYVIVSMEGLALDNSSYCTFLFFYPSNIFENVLNVKFLNRA